MGGRGLRASRYELTAPWRSRLLAPTRVKVQLKGPAANDFLLESDGKNVPHWPSWDRS